MNRMNSIWDGGRAKLGMAWLALVVGLWLIISPFALGVSHNMAGLANNIVSGAALVILTLASTRNGLWRSLIVLMGAWLWASALILQVPSAKYMWNDLLLAFVVIICGVASETPYPNNQPPSA